MKARANGTFSALGQRECQEDHVWKNSERGLYVVADGFGGPVAGAQAARTSCDEIRKFLLREAGDEEATFPYVMRSYYSLAGNILFNSIVHANRKLMKANKERTVHERGGASVLAAYFDESLLALAQVGACSAWLIRDGKMAELVAPKSLSRMIDPTRQNVSETHWDAPLMSLGTSVDLEPEIVEVNIQPWDALILSTDGLSQGSSAFAAQKANFEWFSDILRTARKGEAALDNAGISPEVLVEDFIARAGRTEYSDNASFVVVVF